jgi:hypothetical protein
MSTKAGTIEVPGRPAGFRLWAAAVSVLAAAALIMSAVALTQAGRTSGREAASVGAPWDAGKLEAMRGRVLAETVAAEGSATLWDAGKLEAMQGRVLAETVGAEASATLWDAGKLEAMKGRVLAG